MTNKKKYDAESIDILRGLDPVKVRPEMYTDTQNPNHIALEIIDNSVDEAIAQHAKTITVTFEEDGFLSIADDGRGIPVDLHPEEKKPVLEVILTVLHAGGKFSNKNYQFSGGLHGVGASVTNALSEQLIARVKRDGKAHEMRFSNGEVTQTLRKLPGKYKKTDTGTFISFKPNPKYFNHPDFNRKTLFEHLKGKAILCPGLSINIIECDHNNRETRFYFESGIADFLTDQPSFEQAIFQQFIEFSDENDDMSLSAACYFTEAPSQVQLSFANLIQTSAGGTHVNALRQGLFDGYKEYLSLQNIETKNLKITADDLWRNTQFIISIKMRELSFSSQTKERLATRDCVNYIASKVKDQFSVFLNKHIDFASALNEIVQNNAYYRTKKRKKTERKSLGKAMDLPGKLTDCETEQRDEAELFLVEGDSAGGSAKQARDKETQAIMPLRGKILNTWELDHDSIMDSEEIKNIASAIGVDPDSDDLSQLRYGKICMLADADSDGLHIATLFTALFVKHFRPLIEQGHVFIAQPPLYRIDANKDVYYALDDAEKEQMVASIQHRNPRIQVNVQRFKGLGEMNPEQLAETTLAPNTRRLLQLTIESSSQTNSTLDDSLTCDQFLTMLLGKKYAKERQQWIENYGDQAEV